jgi:hypothetical protein
MGGTCSTNGGGKGCIYVIVKKVWRKKATRKTKTGGLIILGWILER